MCSQCLCVSFLEETNKHRDSEDIRESTEKTKSNTSFLQRRFVRIETLDLQSTLMKWFRISSRPLIVAGALVSLVSTPVFAQQASPAPPVVVQPGAPGEATKTLPSTTRATLPPHSPADVRFMQGMIVHHAQAVDMTALIDSHTKNEELRSLGARISRSQSDEIDFMKRWLQTRGEPISATMPGMHGMDHHHLLMPGMLTKEQMDALKKARGSEFDRLLLKGMIQHHEGALTMVKELFDTPGAGQDAELFNFATDVDSSQRAEIKVMENMLAKNPQAQK